MFNKNHVRTPNKKHRTYTVLDIAGYIVNTNFDKGISMNYKRLNFFLYFAQLQSFITTGQPIFNGCMYVRGGIPCTSYGESNWRGFFNFPMRRITTYWDTSKGILQISKKPFCPHITMYDRALLNDVIKTLNGYSTKDLMGIFHSHDTYKKAIRYYDSEITWKMMCDYIKTLPNNLDIAQ